MFIESFECLLKFFNSLLSDVGVANQHETMALGDVKVDVILDTSNAGGVGTFALESI